jgi:hypothetical protein
MATGVNVDPQAAIQDYLEAFRAREPERCTAFYADDAVIQFQFSRYGGHAAITSWHRERFEANLRVIRIDEVAVEDDGTVTVDAEVASDRLARWSFDSLSVRLTFEFEGGLIRGLKCDLRATPW